MNIVEIGQDEFSKIQSREDVCQIETALFNRESRNLMAFIWDKSPDDEESDSDSLKFFKIVEN